MIALVKDSAKKDHPIDIFLPEPTSLKAVQRLPPEIRDMWIKVAESEIQTLVENETFLTSLVNLDMVNRSSQSSSSSKPSNVAMAILTSSKSVEFNAQTYNGTNQMRIPGPHAPVHVHYAYF